ncbi:MAG: phosphotransacetylase family protein [bacterium]
MKSLFIGSTSRYSGKSLICLGLGSKFTKDGLNIGYIKPIGTTPTYVGDQLTDEDGVFIARALKIDEPLDLLCPVLVTQDFLVNTLEGKIKKMDVKVADAHKKLSTNKDIMLIGGAGNIYEGTFLGLSGLYLLELLKAKLILVDTHQTDIFCIDYLLSVKEKIGDNLLGVILNKVRPEELDCMKRRIIPFLEKKGIKVLGIIPHDRILDSISIARLKEILGGEILCCDNKLDGLIERFSIGAMNVESALKFFRKSKNKAVITGGDRADIQLAALETSTRCIILTGELYPSDIILARAEERGVPVMVVKDDTISTVEKIERILGRLRLREEEKIRKVKEVVEQNINFEVIYEELGLKV